MSEKKGERRPRGGAKNKGRATRKKDPLAPEVGRRIELAADRMAFPSFRAFAEAVGADEKNLREYIKGEVMPGTRALIRLSSALGVSIDWLLMGTERTPAALGEWLTGPIGQTTTADEQRFMRALPLAGYEPDATFYNIALHAMREGLAPDETVLAARDMQRRAARTKKPDTKM